MSVAKRELHDAEGNSRGWYSEANRVNDLTGREWVFWTRSVITKPYPPNLQHALRNRHGGQKPPELCADLLRVFTKEGQRVLDPFMGVGGVLLGASLAGRAAAGIEINPEWIEIYREVCRREGIAEQEAVAGDSREVLPTLGGPALRPRPDRRPVLEDGPGSPLARRLEAGGRGVPARPGEPARRLRRRRVRGQGGMARQHGGDLRAGPRRS